MTDKNIVIVVDFIENILLSEIIVNFQMVSLDSLVLLAKICEIFIQEVILRACRPKKYHALAITSEVYEAL